MLGIARRGGDLPRAVDGEPAVDGIPRDASFTTLPPDWERMAPFLQTAMERVPVTLEAGVRTFFCGPESFTPDLSPVVGESPEVPGYFVAAGLNSIGSLTGGGIGRAIATWIVDGLPDIDVTGMHIDRLHPYQTPHAAPEWQPLGAFTAQIEAAF